MQGAVGDRIAQTLGFHATCRMASIRKRTWKSGDETKTAWVVDYFDQPDKRHIKTFATKKEADAYRTKAQHEVAGGIHTAESTSITVGRAADNWVADNKARGLERSTRDTWDGHVDNHIKPLLGGVKLAALTSPAIEQFATDLRSRPTADNPEQRISASTAKKILGTLKSIIKLAERQGRIAKNPAASVTIKVPARGTKKIRAGRDFPTKAEINAIIRAATGRARAITVTAALTGMRASELRGLLWEEVDFATNVIRVRRRADAWGIMGDPKSEAGERDIPMMPTVANTLKEWKLQCPRRKAKAGDPGSLWLVFPNGNGNIENHSNIVNREFDPLQVAAGVALKTGETDDGTPILEAKYGLHTLRHFFATYMIERGCKPKKLQGLLGHSTIVMTMDTYGHLFDDEGDDQAMMREADIALIS
jgi:integrase